MTAGDKQSPARGKIQDDTRAGEARLSSARRNGGRLTGKTAVVTGASRGIGLATACALAAENCSVFITGRDLRTLDEARSQAEAGLPPASEARVSPVVCDIRSAESVERLFAKVAGEFGHLDVLVNNAGISQAMTSVEETSMELWRDMIDTNLTGLFLCAKAALPLMQSGATIINVLSMAARVPFTKFSAYNSSKHGALGFTLTLREELKDRGIRVTALMPGATNTAIWQQIWPDAPRDRMMDAQTIAHMIVETVILPGSANLSEMLLEPMHGAL